VTILYGYGALRRTPPRLLMRNTLSIITTRSVVGGRKQHALGPRGVTSLLVALARLRRRAAPGWCRILLRQALTRELAGAQDNHAGSPKAGDQRALLVHAIPGSDEELGLFSGSSDDGGSIDIGQVDVLSFEGAARILWSLGTLGIDPGPTIAAVLTSTVEAAATGIEQGNVAASIGQISDDARDIQEQDDSLGFDQGPELTWLIQLLEQARWGAKVLGYHV
jgi:hypothetical protein